MYVYLIIIIIIFFYIFYTSDKRKRKKATYKLNNELSGENFNHHVKDVITNIDNIKNKDALDFYNLGTMFACHVNNPIEALDCYSKTIEEIQKGNVNYDEDVSILLRLENMVERDINQNNDILQQLIPAINTTQNLTHFRKMNHKNLKKQNKSTHTSQHAKRVEMKKTWNSDSQNVHDSSILKNMKSQFNYIKTCNDKNGIPKPQISNIRKWLFKYCNDDKTKTENMKLILQTIENNNKVPNLNGIGEEDLLFELWRRSEDPINEKNKDNIKEAIADSLLNCIENGSLVCPTGRNTRIMASLAMTDKESQDKGIGILKSKEAIRNEIFEDSAKIVEKFTGKNSNTPKKIIDDYNASNSTDAVIKLENNMRLEMQKLKEKYKGKGLDDIKVEQAVDECMSSI